MNTLQRQRAQDGREAPSNIMRDRYGLPIVNSKLMYFRKQLLLKLYYLYVEELCIRVLESRLKALTVIRNSTLYS